jgi:hypothetical protein
VIWVQRPRHHRETFQISLELETYGNVWGIDSPPADWFPPPNEPILEPPVEAPVEVERHIPAPEPVAAGSATDARLSEPKVSHPTDWEVVHVPRVGDAPTSPSAVFDQQDAFAPAPTRHRVNEIVRQTTDAILAEEIALLQKYFTSRLEAVLLESLGTFTALSADIVAQTRAACLESAKQMEADLRRITQQAADTFPAAPPKKPRVSKRKKKEQLPGK